MKVKELKLKLKNLNDNDEVMVNIHDDVFYEDNYDLYVDIVDMTPKHNQIWLCHLQNTKYVSRKELEAKFVDTFSPTPLDNHLNTTASIIKNLTNPKTK